MNPRPLDTVRLFAFSLAVIALMGGCRTAPKLPAADLSEPGWRVQHGQAVWKPRRAAPEIAGEVLLATHPNGRSLVQFTKTPFPIVVAQSFSNRWEIQFVPEHRVFGGHGQPPKYFGWLHLATALAARSLPESFTFSRADENRWLLDNRATGEFIEGYLAP